MQIFAIHYFSHNSATKCIFVVDLEEGSVSTPERPPSPLFFFLQAKCKKEHQVHVYIHGSIKCIKWIISEGSFLSMKTGEEE